MKNQYETPEQWFHGMGTQFVVAQVNFHLNQVGVFNLIHEAKNISVPEIASRLKLNEKALSCLLEYAAGVDRLLIEKDGQYSFSEFGQAVLKRYGRVENGEAKFNFLDVRIGAYGNIWQNMSGLMNGELEYGKNIKRDGRFAEDGVFKSSSQFIPGITKAIDGLPYKSITELGVNSGLIEKLTSQFKGSFAGVDRSPETIDKAAARHGGDQVTWIVSDLQDVDQWVAKLPVAENTVLFSIHFHEFMALGEAELGAVLKELRGRLKNSWILALEQPKPQESDRQTISETMWQYSHSNVLIHHLIGNGKVLSEQDWIELFAKAGWPLLKNEATNYLGYRAFLFG